MTENLCAIPNEQVESVLRPNFPSFVERNLFSDFKFQKERDANHFARSYGGLAPAKDFIKGTWVVRL
jgi:hypothetical protein